MAKATKLSSGNWRCKAYFTDEDGKYTSKSFTASTKKEAEGAAAAWLMEMKHYQKPENKTIGELVDRYLDSRSNLLSPSTLLGYRKKRKAAFQEIMDVRAGFLTRDMYQSAVNNYTKGRSPKTVLEAHSLMRMVFEASNIRIDMKSIQLPQKVKTEIQVPDTEAVRTIMEACKEKGIFLPVLLASTLGLRRSEIFALTWGDVDIDKRTLKVNKALVQDESKVYVIKQTKTFNSNRVLELSDEIIDALPPCGADNEPIIELSCEAFTCRYKRLMKRIGMSKYTFHSLRHYFASIMLLSGVPSKYAMERMGHSTDNMLKKVYQHTYQDVHKEHTNKLQEYFRENGIGK